LTKFILIGALIVNSIYRKTKQDQSNLAKGGIAVASLPIATLRLYSPGGSIYGEKNPLNGLTPNSFWR